ncbi:MAG: FxLYD domain-containing protein [Pseudonocardiaceae bacterium]
MTQSAASTVPRNGFGITALVLAVIGLIFGLVPFPGFIALILGMLAVLFGMLGWSRARQGIATNRTVTVMGTLLGIGAAALGVWSVGILIGAVDKLGKGPHDVGRTTAALDDVAVLGCSVTSQYGVSSVHAMVRITNNTDRTQTYLATIRVSDANGAGIGRINAVGNSLGAGQSVTTSGTDASATAVSDARLGPVRCVVASVNRFPSSITCPQGEFDAKLC